MSLRRPGVTSASEDPPYQAISQMPDAELNVDGTTVEDSVDALVSDTVAIKIRWVYFMLGCAGLLPWNALISAMPFFLSRLSGTPLRATFSSYLSSSFTAAEFVFLALATATIKGSSPSLRATASMWGMVVLTLLLVLSTFIYIPPGWFFAFVISNGIAQAVTAVYLSTSYYAGAALFGPACMQAVMAGQAAIAVAVSSVQVASAIISVWGDDKPRTQTFADSDGKVEQRAALIFLSVSALFVVATVVAHSWMMTLPVYKAKVGVLEPQKQLAVVSEDDSDERQSLISAHEPTPTSSHNRAQIIRVFKTNFLYEFSVAYAFAVTLAVFPPITLSIESTNPNIHPLLFSSFHFLVFNIGDLLGRYICSFPRLLIWSAEKLTLLSALRTLFIPLFLMCNVQRPSTTIVMPIITSDLLYMIILLVFGLTNGYVTSLCMMAAPSLEHNPRLKGRQDDVDIAAAVANFSIIAGLVMGSVASFAVRAAICDCNPFRE